VRETGLRYADNVRFDLEFYELTVSDFTIRNKHQVCQITFRSMGEIIKFRKPTLKAKAEGKTLCRSGFHRWKVVTERTFDVKQGKLVTRRRCERCGKEQTILR
jgi:ribosomal protein S14